MVLTEVNEMAEELENMTPEERLEYEMKQDQQFQESLDAIEDPELRKQMEEFKRQMEQLEAEMEKQQ